MAGRERGGEEGLDLTSEGRPTEGGTQTRGRRHVCDASCVTGGC